MTSQAARKRASDREYKKAREQRLVRTRGRCERCLVNAATQTHHVVRRAHKPDVDIHAVDNLRALCLECHEHIHAHVAESKREGWIATNWPQLGEAS